MPAAGTRAAVRVRGPGRGEPTRRSGAVTTPLTWQHGDSISARSVVAAKGGVPAKTTRSLLRALDMAGVSPRVALEPRPHAER